MWYCVCDIKLKVAEEVVRTDFTQIRPNYESVSGWLTPDAVDSLREAIKADVVATMVTIREQEGDVSIASATDYDPDGTIEELF